MKRGLARGREISPLRGAEMSRLLGAYLGGGRLPTPDSDRLLATALGNPFYLAELITLLIERGAFLHTGTGQGLAPGSSPGSSEEEHPKKLRVGE